MNATLLVMDAAVQLARCRRYQSGRLVFPWVAWAALWNLGGQWTGGLSDGRAAGVLARKQFCR